MGGSIVPIIMQEFQVDDARCTAEYPEDMWHQVIAVNLTGVWLCMKYEIPQMLQQGSGAIVNTASVAGLVGSRGLRPMWRVNMGWWDSPKQRRWSMPTGDSGQLRLSRVYPHADDGTRLERSRTEGTHHCQ